MPTNRRLLIVPLGLVAMVSLVLATWAGLAQLGVHTPPPPVPVHGPLMILGFLGTVICVERAVGLGRVWAWAAPILAAVGTVFVLAGQTRIGMGVLFCAGVALAVVYAVALVIAEFPDHLLVQSLGAFAWMAATAALFAGRDMALAVPVMIVYLVLTVIGERLELSRLAPNASTVRNRVVVGAAVGVLGFSVGAIWAGLEVTRLAGVGILTVAVLSYLGDIARRTRKAGALTGFMAAAILGGYVWLAVSGLLWAAGAMDPAKFIYDAALHTVVVGFVLSMVFAHAPVIVPSVAGVALPFNEFWWVPLGLLHLTLLLRVTGDVFEVVALRTAGGVGNVVALAAFLVVAVSSGVSARRT